MTVTLIIESTPTPQAKSSFVYNGGTFVIGRGQDADWQLDDPERYVSRRHCILTLDGDTPVLTDASRGGTFIDGSETPLGNGQSVALEDGMRLRLGEIVLRIDMVTAADRAPVTMNGTSPNAGFTWSDDAADPEPEKRPDSLPDPFAPFDQQGGSVKGTETATGNPMPFEMDDPFALDTTPSRSTSATPEKSSGGYFDVPLTRASPVDDPPVSPEDTSSKPDRSADVLADSQSTDAQAQTASEDLSRLAPVQEPPVHASENDDALAAILRGMGLKPDVFQGQDAVIKAEAIGAQYRMLLEGVMQLLRARASAKQQVRAAQTLISSRDVNPLKFMATTDDALAAMLSEERQGYQGAEASIHEAFRDLADHQVRTWKALQSALRRMIDQFDPDAIEKDIEDAGVLEALLAGGKNAMIWQAYQERYRDIARAAEERFLGEVGENFRDAYEGTREEDVR